MPLLFLLTVSPQSPGQSASWAGAGFEPVSRISRKEDPWFSQDKASHLTISAFLTGLTYRVYHDEFSNGEKNSRFFAITFTAVTGIGKEIMDSTIPSSTASSKSRAFGWKDLAADGAGILLGLLLFTSILN